MPEVNLQRFILNNAQQALNSSGGVSAHQKLDNTRFFYSTRSFGVGSAVGLTNFFAQPVMSYSFSENGLRAQVECLYNQSTQYILEPLTIPKNLSWSLHVYNAKGYLPNGAQPIYAAAGLADDQVTAIGAGSSNDTHYVAFATMPSTRYASLSDLQCQVFYEPMRFVVRVNVTDKTINVQPVTEIVSLPNNALLAAVATHKITNLGSMLSSTQWTSVIGDTMTRNIQTVEAVQGRGNVSALVGVSTALESIIDSFLEALSAAQLQILHNSEVTAVQTESMAFVFGEPSYLYAVLVITLIITLAYLGELVLTRRWKDAPAFDLVDIEDVIVAASNGGNALAKKSKKMTEQGSIERMAVTLLDCQHSPALTLAPDTSDSSCALYEICHDENPET
ncbi:hypothetical protein F5884DRAFT_834320 [Xylogone sp. PMI_703]|nr:hypothetical protein F5884DRAFT_834320 [Xylogone sp. PMI_703]